MCNYYRNFNHAFQEPKSYKKRSTKIESEMFPYCITISFKADYLWAQVLFQSLFHIYEKKKDRRIEG
jgi:hypothetical protein